MQKTFAKGTKKPCPAPLWCCGFRGTTLFVLTGLRTD